MTSSNIALVETMNKINKSEVYCEIKKPISNLKPATNFSEKSKILTISLDDEKSQTLIKINGNESLLEIRNILNKIIEKEPYLLKVTTDEFLFGSKDAPISKVFENDFSMANIAYSNENNNLKLNIFSTEYLNTNNKKQKTIIRENLDSASNYSMQKSLSLRSDRNAESPNLTNFKYSNANFSKSDKKHNSNYKKNPALYDDEVKIESSSECGEGEENRSFGSKNNFNFNNSKNERKMNKGKNRNADEASRTSDFEDADDSSYDGSKNEDTQTDFKTKFLNRKRKKCKKGYNSKSEEHYLYDIIPYYLYSKTREELTQLIGKYGLNPELKSKPEMKEELFRYFEEQKEIMMKNNTWNLKLNDKKMFIYNQYAKLTRYELLQKFKFLFFHMTKLEMLEKVVQVLYRQLRSA